MSRKRLSRCGAKPRNTKRAIAILALLLAVGYVAIGQQSTPRAAEPAPQPTQQPSPPVVQPSPQPTSEPSAGAGVKAYIDPATGQLRPAEQEEMRAAPAQAPATLLRSTAPQEPQTFQHPSGAIGVVLGPEHTVFSVATIGKDGKIQYECVQGEAAAGKKVAAPRQGGLDVQ